MAFTAGKSSERGVVILTVKGVVILTVKGVVMTLLRIIFVFIYLKILGLGKGIVFSIKYIGKNFLIPSFVGIFTVFALGAVSLGVWYFFHQLSATSFIQHNAKTHDYVYGVIKSCLGIGGAEFVVLFLGVGLFLVVWENWHHVSELIVDNWQKAVHIVLGGR